MKLALLTDLHANREALEAVLAHAAQQHIDQYAFLGDYVGYGADPAWVVDRLREFVAAGAFAVKGNHDEATVRGPQPAMREDANAAVQWTRDQLDAEQLRFLDELPLMQESGSTLFVHANAFAPSGWAYIDGRLEAIRSLQATSARYTFCGHMHEPKLYHLSLTSKAGDFQPAPGIPIPLSPLRRWLAIPGSAGQPRDGNPAACYAIFDEANEVLTFHRVPYDTDAAAAKILAAGLPPPLAERLKHGH
ncbi:metallophosphoesterase [Aquabacterium sp.]|uniref:metallophosphoesterase family protein n=1 Tax=Aquabacterium sp. TaxID=1872578 RepID=UPI0035B38C99